MTESSLGNVRRIYSGLPNWLLITTFLLPVLGFLLGWFTGITTSPANTRFVLSALAGAKASVLAIVFSVTVIGVQLAGNRYSPRMISLFVKSPILIFTFFLFILSIAVDISLLFNIPSTGLQLHLAGVYAATGLSIAAAITLFSFIRASIRQSTPEGIINAFVQDLTPGKYLTRVERYVEDELQNVHPLQPLYSMTMEALSNRRRATAEIALKNYGHLAINTLNEFIQRDTFSQFERPITRALFKPVLEEHLHRIVLHAEEQDESQLVGDATEWIYKIGETGLDLPEPLVSRQAVWGLSNVIIHAPIGSGEYISNDSAWRQLGNLLVDAAEHPRPQVVWTAASTIKNRGPQMIWRAHDGRRFRHSMTTLYGKMTMAHEELLDHYGEELAEVDMDWQHEHVPDETPNRERITSIDRLRKSFFRTTEAFFGYLEEEGEYPITEGDFRDAWKNICVDASNSPAQEYAITLCQALIETSYISGCIKPDDEFWWMDSLARVKYKGAPEIVDKAFEQVLSYQHQEEGPGIWPADEQDEVQEKYYQNLIRVQDFQPLNTHPDFPDRVENLRKQVDDRWEELKD